MLEKYISLLNISHIDKFAKSKGYTLTNQELDFLYDKIKNNYKEIINNPSDIFSEAKCVLRKDVYDEVLKLYNEYKKKLGNYL